MTSIPVNNLWGEPIIPKPDKQLAEMYRTTGRTLDDLPYTPEFARLYEAVRRELAAEPFSESERALFNRLLTLRKRAVLPRLGGAWSDPIKLTEEEEERVVDLVVDRIGRLAQRDQLPYTDEFNQILDAFNGPRSQRHLSPHELWRVICRLAK